MKLVISQPMFFPWIGMFEQINLADIYIHLDDVQMPGGQSFVHRVQLKGASGIFWWNMPINRDSTFSIISEVGISLTPTWISKSFKSLEQTFSGLPYKNDVLDLFEETVTTEHSSMSEFNIFSIELISRYLELDTKFKRINRENLVSDKTDKIIEILKNENATSYISGLGGMNYLKKELFDINSIKLLFMRYENIPYNQKYGIFDPYVSIFHPIAALGKDAKKLLISKAH